MILASHGIIGSQIASASLLLDLYPSAALAYSVRKLRTLYTGNAIRVRRSSDNAEQNIAFVGNNLDTASLTSFCSGTDGFVTTWYDQSGNARDAIQATASLQPQIVSSGSVLDVNAKPSLKFDGNNDIMKFIGSGTSSSNTMFVLSKSNSNVASYQTIASIGDIRPATALAYLYFGVTPNNSRAIYSDVLTSQDGARTLVQELVTIDAFSTSIAMYVNNANQSLTNNLRVLTSNLNNVQIGNDTQYSDPYNGNIQEVILYTTAQTSNVSGINTNINAYYGIY
jgi:hypothetical protein